MSDESKGCIICFINTERQPKEDAEDALTKQWFRNYLWGFMDAASSKTIIGPNTCEAHLKSIAHGIGGYISSFAESKEDAKVIAQKIATALGLEVVGLQLDKEAVH